MIKNHKELALTVIIFAIFFSVLFYFITKSVENNKVVAPEKINKIEGVKEKLDFKENSVIKNDQILKFEAKYQNNESVPNLKFNPTIKNDNNQEKTTTSFSHLILPFVAIIVLCVTGVVYINNRFKLDEEK